MNSARGRARARARASKGRGRGMGRGRAGQGRPGRGGAGRGQKKEFADVVAGRLIKDFRVYGCRTRMWESAYVVNKCVWVPV